MNYTLQTTSVPIKVTIVTPSYNQGRFIEEAILSVLNQTYRKNIEYIVVDAGSTDGSRDIIQKYASKIDKIIFEPDNGPADGLNKGFRIASGDIFGYLNADDILFPHAIETLVGKLQKTPTANVLSGHGIILDESGKPQRKIYSHRFSPLAYIYGICVVVQQSTLFTRQAFLEVNGFNIQNSVNWDGELWLDIALWGGNFSRVHEFLSGFRIYKESITGSGKYKEKILAQHKRMAAKMGIRYSPSKVIRTFLWLINRLTDPAIALRQLFYMFLLTVT